MTRPVRGLQSDETDANFDVTDSIVAEARENPASSGNRKMMNMTAKNMQHVVAANSAVHPATLLL